METASLTAHSSASSGWNPAVGKDYLEAVPSSHVSAPLFLFPSQVFSIDGHQLLTIPRKAWDFPEPAQIPAKQPAFPTCCVCPTTAPLPPRPPWERRQRTTKKTPGQPCVPLFSWAQGQDTGGWHPPRTRGPSLRTTADLGSTGHPKNSSLCGCA